MNTEKLRKHLERINKYHGNCAGKELISNVVRGVKHLEKNDFPWVRAVFSPEFISWDSLARILVGEYEFDKMSGEAIRKALKIPRNTHEEYLGLDWLEEDETVLMRTRFLWLHSAIFMRMNIPKYYPGNAMYVEDKKTKNLRFVVTGPSPA